MSGIGAVSGYEKNWLDRERSEAGAGGRGAENGAGIGSHRNRFER